ncbi:MAG: diguanylate cyclase [Piscirickettsiaceae bacterium]|nr:MAG: diguanylate cyclase [Piscirickettsiaceae bacterium]
MQKQDAVTQSSEFLRQTIPMLTKHGLMPTPTNYAVLYGYISGQSQALKESIDNVIAKKQTLSTQFIAELHEQHIGGGLIHSKQEEVQHGLEKIISNTSEEIQHVNNDTHDFDSSLTKHAEKLSSATDADVAAMILQQIMQDTRAMAKSVEEAQARMEASHVEIEKMREELQSVKETAEKDALTGLKNRGSFDKFIHDVVHQQKSGETHHLIMLDIDHFKRINDNFGHLVGDRVIRYVSALMRQIFGADQHIARYGGEEFATVISNKTLDECFNLADKVRIAMGNSKLQRKDSGETIGKVTMSAGISVLQADDTVDSFIDRADKALYFAKENGRNKTVLPTDLA